MHVPTAYESSFGVLSTAAREASSGAALADVLDSSGDAKVKLSPSRPKRLLYMDGLNYTAATFFTPGRPHWEISRGRARVRSFVLQCHNAGWDLKVFIDAALKKGEAHNKWVRRREQEVKMGYRLVPQGLHLALGDAFREQGVEVLYSYAADKDDTLAAFAERDGAAVLSNDYDFLCYIGSTFPVYGDLKIDSAKNLIQLGPEKQNRRGPATRDILVPPPETTTIDPCLCSLHENIYRRGAPSPLVRNYGNPHIAVRPLRQALYARRGVKGLVLETFPVWSEHDQKVVWTDDLVEAAPLLDDCLDDPQKALGLFFPESSRVQPAGVSSKDWEDHVYSFHAVVYELCAMASGGKLTFLQLISQAAAQRRLGTHHDQSVEPYGASSYTYNCRGCNTACTLQREQIAFYQSKGFPLPKLCKACKAKQAHHLHRHQQASAVRT